MKEAKVEIPIIVEYRDLLSKDPLLDYINPKDGNNEKEIEQGIYLRYNKTEEIHGHSMERLALVESKSVDYFVLMIISSYLVPYIGYRTYPYLDKAIDKLVALIKQGGIEVIKIGTKKISPTYYPEEDLKRIIKRAIKEAIDEYIIGTYIRGRTIRESREALARFQLPEWIPKDLREIVDELAKKRDMTPEEYLLWLWNTTTPKEAKKYREIAETLAKITMTQENLSDLLVTLRVEVLKSKEDLDTIEQLIHKAQARIQQAKKYFEQGHFEKAEELFKQANDQVAEFELYLPFNYLSLKVEKRNREIEKLNVELDNLTQKLLELTNGDNDLLNTAKIYALLEWLSEVS